MGILSKFFKKDPPRLVQKPFETLDETITFVTDTATLSIFDPLVLQHKILEDSDWWSQDFATYPEIQQGLISLLNVQYDGHYKIRFTSLPVLSEIDLTHYKKVNDPLGFKVASGQVFIGAGECLPGDDYSPTIDSIQSDQGVFITLVAGDYDLSLYELSTLEKMQNKCIAINQQPADIILQISPRKTPFPGVVKETHLFNKRV